MSSYQFTFSFGLPGIANNEGQFIDVNTLRRMVLVERARANALEREVLRQRAMQVNLIGQLSVQRQTTYPVANYSAQTATNIHPHAAAGAAAAVNQGRAPRPIATANQVALVQLFAAVNQGAAPRPTAASNQGTAPRPVATVNQVALVQLFAAFNQGSYARLFAAANQGTVPRPVAAPLPVATPLPATAPGQGTAPRPTTDVNMQAALRLLAAANNSVIAQSASVTSSGAIKWPITATAQAAARRPGTGAKSKPVVLPLESSSIRKDKPLTAAAYLSRKRQKTE
ncbi:hypothetical protein GGH91_000006 [Coemansia sp. RSA 2671]|nr:hypothetical protein GGH91_000006 [Coemansia sp. RSA 2671]